MFASSVVRLQAKLDKILPTICDEATDLILTAASSVVPSTSQSGQGKASSIKSRPQQTSASVAPELDSSLQEQSQEQQVDIGKFLLSRLVHLTRTFKLPSGKIVLKVPISLRQLSSKVASSGPYHLSLQRK